MVQPLRPVPPSDEEDVARWMAWRLKRIARRQGRSGAPRWILSQPPELRAVWPLVTLNWECRHRRAPRIATYPL